jgi:HAE1 family hydrophobic/amphiphilic exporter-1
VCSSDLQKINQSLEMENINIPAGSIKNGGMEYFMRVPSRFRNAQDVRDTVIGSWKGNPVYLKDVATVSVAFEPPEFNAWGDGESGIVVMVQRQAGKNTVEVIQSIRKRLDSLQKELPPDVKINIVADNSEDILNSVRNLTDSLLWGIVFVIVVTLAFLRRVKPSIIISLMIPFSMIVAFIFLLLNGDTINLISLMALAIVSGMVVDNGIVVLENIIRHFEAGASPYNAAVDGASEMWLAITGSTLTTVIVFIPLMFLSGLAGIIFKVLGYVLTVTLIASLFTAIMIVPLMCSRWLKKPDPEKEINRKDLASRLTRASENIFRLIDVESHLHCVIYDSIVLKAQSPKCCKRAFAYAILAAG